MLVNRIARLAGVLSALVALVAFASPSAQARRAYALKEMKACVYCHVVPGGDRNFRGIYYATHMKSFADFDNVYEAKAAGVKPEAMGPDAVPTVAGYPRVKTPAVLDFTMKDIDGNPVKLARYAGNVIMIINVASKCGNTPQYEGLEKIYEKYKGQGFTILAFPANDFGKQEPGDEKTIKEFCEATYKVKFPLFSKVIVKGDDKVSLYKFLTSKETNEQFAGDIDWNFAKFLVNRKGEVVARFKAGVKPESEPVISAIEKELAAPKPE
ncbi:MAG TPA: glutathione peroxidase [Chthonomonadaceae bacterium]|nr:glutathione peroxidase [Chthonomonadaceae bacterium]